MPRTIRARWVFPGDGPPIPDGCVSVEGSTIVRVGPCIESPAVDLGDVALLPGLVNAHTHLEFSHLQAPLGQAGDSFPNWIRKVVNARRAESQPSTDANDARHRAIELGLSESSSHGVVALGEIATAGWTPEPYVASELGGTIFLELIGLAESRVDELTQVAESHLAFGPKHQSKWQMGLSPHAPYTVHPRLLERICNLAARKNAAVAMHLAESREELQLLESHSGPFVELLCDLDAWQPDAISRGTRILDYLKILSRVPRSLIIHGNYLAEDEIDFLARHRDQMTVVYCPRTHAYFQHERYPLSKLLRAGVCVALGTDSRASSPDLNLVEELLAVAHTHPEISPIEIVDMATARGASALGVGERLGRLRPGYEFSVTAVPLPSANEPTSFLQ